MTSNPLKNESILNDISKFSSLLTENVTLVNSANDLQQICFFRFEKEVEISVPNVKFCTFNSSACTFRTKNEGEKNSKERKMRTTLYVTVEHEIHADNQQCSLVWIISKKKRKVVLIILIITEIDVTTSKQYVLYFFSCTTFSQ
jgi:hypothetical protein